MRKLYGAHMPQPADLTQQPCPCCGYTIIDGETSVTYAEKLRQEMWSLLESLSENSCAAFELDPEMLELAKKAVVKREKEIASRKQHNQKNSDAEEENDLGLVEENYFVWETTPPPKESPIYGAYDEKLKWEELVTCRRGCCVDNLAGESLFKPRYWKKRPVII